MQSILTSLPGAPVVCSLHVISKGAASSGAMQRSNFPPHTEPHPLQTPSQNLEGWGQPETPVPRRDISIEDTPSASAYDQEARGKPDVEHWLLVSRLEAGKQPLIMQIPMDSDADLLGSNGSVEREFPAESQVQLFKSPFKAQGSNLMTLNECLILWHRSLPGKTSGI